MSRIGVPLLAFGLAFLLSQCCHASLTGLPAPSDGNYEYLFGSSSANATLALEFENGDSLSISSNGNQGWWSGTLANQESNSNYIVGDLSSNGTMLLNNFFTFGLSSESGGIVRATLRMQRFTGKSSQGKPAHSYHLFHVETAAAELNANSGVSAAIFQDLGSGVTYGAFDISVDGDQTEILSLALNDDAIADMNAAVGGGSRSFSIGGTLFPVGEPVPEPSTLTLLGLLGLGLAFARCRCFPSAGPRRNGTLPQ